MRIVSYNVRYFGHALKGLASTASTKRRIAQALASLSPLPDVICLQEIESRSLRSRRGATDEPQLEAFLRHWNEAVELKAPGVRYHARYYPAHAYGARGLNLYTTGLAVLVREDAAHIILDNVGSPHDVTHYGKGPLRALKQRRIGAFLTLEPRRGRTFHVFNTHLSLPTPFSKDFWKQGGRLGFGKNQQVEAESLARFAKEAAGGAPYLVCGDFNSAPLSPVYDALTKGAGLVSAQAALGQVKLKRPDEFPTAGFMHLRMHLDHVMSGGPVQWNDMTSTRPFGDVESAFHGLSDHVPLIADFSV